MGMRRTRNRPRSCCIAAAGATVVWTVGCKDNSSPPQIESAVVADATGSGPATVRPRSGTPIGGFARLEAATEGIPPNPLVGSVARLERARAWVADNMGDRSPREQELQSQMIAVVESVLGGELSLDRFGSLMEFETLELWSRDADGDGVLSESEASESDSPLGDAFDDSLLYFGGRFDTDGDGVISDDESDAANEALEKSVSPMMQSLVDRVVVVEWDANGDGVVSDNELAMGHVSLGLDADDPRIKDSGIEERFELYMPLVDGFETASRFMDPLEWSAPPVQESIPASPTRGDYDFDGDGTFSAVEQQAFDAEHEAWRGELNAYYDRVRAASVLSSYEATSKVMDSDGDGRIADGEWSDGFGSLRQQRDARVFRYLYDRDGNGGFGESEVVRFMNAYDAGSIYADADMNGTVDVKDVVLFRDRVLGQ